MDTTTGNMIIVHGHEHGLEHFRAPEDSDAAFAIGVFLNLGLVLAWWASRLKKCPLAPDHVV